MFASNVQETTTTTGTGNLTLAGATTGAVAINAVFSNDASDAGGLFQYGIEHQTIATEWEAGLGYLSAAGTMVRAYVEASSNSGAAVNFSAGTKNVTCTPIGQGVLPTYPNVAAGGGNRIAVAPWIGSSSLGGVGADTIYFTLHYNAVMADADAVTAEFFTNGDAGSNFVGGIYVVDKDLAPRLLLVTGAEGDGQGVGFKHSTFTARKIPPGPLVLAFCHSSANAPSMRRAVINTAIPLGYNGGFASPYSGWTEARTYDSALPATPTLTKVQSGQPILGLRHV